MIIILLDRQLQALGEKDRRWSSALQRPHELHPGTGKDWEILRAATNRVVQAMEAADRSR